MSRLVGMLGTVVAAASIFVGGASHGAAPVEMNRAGSRVPPDARSALARVGPLFVENRGQVDAAVGCYLRTAANTVFFTANGVTYSLPGDERRWAVAVDFAGARDGVRPEGRDVAPTLMSWFHGRREQWVTGARTFHEVAYRGVWPGIDAVFRVEDGRLKYRFDVAAGADPSRIRLSVRGGESVNVDGAGRLVAKTPLGDVVDEAPRSWQETDAGRAEVSTRYALGPAGADGARDVRFELGARDPSLPLVVDPAVLIHLGYLGGDGSDTCTGVAVDGDGSAYVSGSTNSAVATFPATVGPFLARKKQEDAFVGKLTPDGTGFVYLGYIVGESLERAHGIAIDAQKNAYVVGVTGSDETSSTFSGGFPATVGPDLTFNGFTDLFVAKVNAAGTSLVYCGYIGGASEEGRTETGTTINPAAIAVDSSGNAYVASNTNSSTDDGFPVTVGPGATYHPGTPDGFVAKVKADGTGLLYCGYIGGTNQEFVEGIGVDGTGHAYVVGTTQSSEASFPVVVGPDLTQNGNRDAFVTKVKPDGSGLDYCGYIGGSGVDRGTCVAVDAQGHAYVAGEAQSSEATFPATVGPDVTFNTGALDAFVAKVKLDGSGLDYCGYIGGDDSDRANAIAIDAAGNAYVAGYTHTIQNSAVPFPARCGPGLTYTPFIDGFVAEVNASGTSLVYAGYVGSGVTYANAVAVDVAGNAYVAGVTDNANLGATVGPDLTYNGGLTDGFVGKIGPGGDCPGGGGGGTVDSFFLPKKVSAKANAKTPAKSVLTTSGFFDTGSAAVDLAHAATLTIGGVIENAPALVRSADGKSYSYAANGVTFTVVPNPFGSSRAKFKLKRTGDFAGEIPVAGDLLLHFTNGVVDARSDVKLAAGKYSLGHVRGALVAPGLFVVRARAKVVGAGKDALSLVVGLATGGTTPPAASDVTVAFGNLHATVTASKFVRKGDTYQFKGDEHGVTSIVLDYVKETVTVTAKNTDLGAFAEGPNPVEIDVAVGADSRVVKVRASKKGTTLKY